MRLWPWPKEYGSHSRTCASSRAASPSRVMKSATLRLGGKEAFVRYDTIGGISLAASLAVAAGAATLATVSVGTTRTTLFVVAALAMACSWAAGAGLLIGEPQGAAERPEVFTSRVRHKAVATIVSLFALIVVTELGGLGTILISRGHPIDVTAGKTRPANPRLPSPVVAATTLRSR
jgi:hypothetical protein